MQLGKFGDKYELLRLLCQNLAYWSTCTSLLPVYYLCKNGNNQLKYVVFLVAIYINMPIKLKLVHCMHTCTCIYENHN